MIADPLRMKKNYSNYKGRMAECEPVSIAGCVSGDVLHPGEGTSILIGEDNLQEQQDEVMAIQLIYEGGEEERIQVISQPDDTGHGFFQMQIKIPMIAPSQPCQVDLMVPETPQHSPAQGGQGEEGASAEEGGGAKEEGGLKEEGGGAKEDGGGAKEEGGEAKKEGGVLEEEGAKAAGVPPSYFGKRVSLQRSLSGRRWTGSFNVQHLCPLTLHVTLPPTYPSSDPPVFSLSSVWLRREHLSALCRQLDKLWEANANMPVVFTWVHWLENETFGCLGLTSNIVMMPEDSSYDNDNGGFDGRALIECEDFGQAVHTLQSYNNQLEAIEFCKAIQECCLCLDEKNGTNFLRLDLCKHHFCFDCMAAHANLHVTDGTVQLLTCPGYECNMMVPPDVLQMVLSPDAFIRWETLSLQRSLDEMGDVVYCPRCQAVVIREQDTTLKLGHCLTCCYSFCTDCEQPWHIGTMCRTELERVEEMGQRTQTQDQRARECYRELRRQAEEKMATVQHINLRTMSCPTCKIPIEKMEGCNMMKCRCGNHFCWVCGKAVTSEDHFKNGCMLFQDQESIIHTRIIHGRRDPEALLWMRAQAQAHDLENVAALEICCVQCKQKNIKVDRNNHIRCWNCKTNVCFHCRGRISGMVTRHFAAGPCPQHS